MALGTEALHATLIGSPAATPKRVNPPILTFYRVPSLFQYAFQLESLRGRSDMKLFVRKDTQTSN
jgi:hypothetical protein